LNLTIWRLFPPWQALRRTFLTTTGRDDDKDAYLMDAEFAPFLRNFVFFAGSWAVLEPFETGASARMAFANFSETIEKIGVDLQPHEAEHVFLRMGLWRYFVFENLCLLIGAPC
jgi:hypothetical protein